MISESFSSINSLVKSNPIVTSNDCHTQQKTSDLVSQVSLPILISGAGIAGLALANALSNMNDELEPSQRVKYIIIERDNKADARNQGYGLTLLRENYTYLKSNKVLPKIDERIVTLTEGYESHEKSGKLLSLDLKEDKTQLKRVISRGELRDSLMDRVGKDTIQWNTMVTHFEKTEKGILVHLISDGIEKSVLVSNLIATDGVNSKIRNTIVHDTKKYLGVVGIYGRIPNSMAAELLEREFQVDDDKGWRMFAKPYNVENYNWQMFFPWEESKPLPDNKQMLDYIAGELSKNQWNPNYINLIKKTDPETMRCGLLYDRDHLKPLEEAGAVTLIGDSAHAVSPYKGRGANLALEGVQVYVDKLKEAILKGTQQGKGLDWANVNRSYESKHWPHAATVQLGCRQSVWDHHFAITAGN